MELTLRQIYFAYPVLSKFVNQNMPIKAAFKIGKIIKKLEEEFELIEKQRINLVNKYGQKTEEGIKVEQSKITDFATEFEILLKEKTDILIEQITLDTLPDEIKLSPRDLVLIDFVFDEKQEPNQIKQGSMEHYEITPKLTDDMC